MATIDLLYNLSLLVAICVVSGFIDDRFNRNTHSQVEHQEKFLSDSRKRRKITS